jgi:hypothetical protein
MKIEIVGAGMAGLLAANMLKRHNPVVFESQASLPNNHSAVLRFGSNLVGDVIGVPFKKVSMIKTYLPWRNKVADCLQYSYKCAGVHRSDRSITREAFSEERWISPPTLISTMAEGIDINYEYKWSKPKGPTISTLPMPILAKLLGYEFPEETFKYVHGANLKAQVKNCDAYMSLYVPDPKYSFNRVSITGDELIAEYAFKSFPKLELKEIDRFSEMSTIRILLGVYFREDSCIIKEQKYAKIQPIDERLRRDFLVWATDKHNIFSLGRFATWRPGLLLDSLVQDIRLIEKWISTDRYSMRFHR